LLSTQFLWFLIPSLIAASGRLTIPQSRYSTGVMAVMHSAQYLWITSYYARREATTATSRWRPLAYFAILVVGGIALFIPGPWLASYVFHFDFTTSFLIFTALVNLHHFILDGAIWKLRDGRIASLLLNSPSRVTKAAGDVGGAMMRFARWSVGASSGARGLRIGTACALLLLAALDQTRFVLGMSTEQPWRLQQAAALDPYDGTMQLRIARAEASAGHTDAALAAFRRAAVERPDDTNVRDTFLRYLISQQKYQEAFQLTTDGLARTPNDVDLLVNRGILANNLGNVEAAHASWAQAIALDPKQFNAHLYLAESFANENQPALALPHYRAFLDGVAMQRPGERQQPDVVVGALLHMADCLAKTGENRRVLRLYDEAAKIANSADDKRLQSVVASTAAEFEDKEGNFGEALRLYQDALRADSAMQSPALEASDLFNYAQLLREHHLETMAYACLLRARALLNPAAPEFATLDKSVKDIELSSPATQLATIRRDPDSALAQALALLN
jgi:tetratricopeptide (TPR) repeat protein